MEALHYQEAVLNQADAAAQIAARFAIAAFSFGFVDPNTVHFDARSEASAQFSEIPAGETIVLYHQPAPATVQKLGGLSTLDARLAFERSTDQQLAPAA